MSSNHACHAASMRAQSPGGRPRSTSSGTTRRIRELDDGQQPVRLEHLPEAPEHVDLVADMVDDQRGPHDVRSTQRADTVGKVHKAGLHP